MLLARRLLLGAIGTLPLARRAQTQTPQSQPAHRLTILHVNDFHSRHDPVDSRNLTCSNGEACFGSSPRLAAAIREQRAAAEQDGRTVILLDAGDQFQGSLFYTAHHGQAELAVQHAVGTDAMTLGNHEFDNGPETLARYAAAARFPILSANIDATNEPALAPHLKPWTILNRGALKIGIVGLTTQEARTSSSPGPNIRFDEPGPALATAAAAARNAGATIILVLSHLGLPMDRRLDVPGIAAIIGGHTHTLLSNTEPAAAGPHPTISRHGPLIVQAGCYGRYLGRLDLELAPDGAVIAYGGAVRRIGQDLTPDPEVAAIVASFAAPLEALRRKPVATLPEPLDVALCRIAQCPLGTLAAQALRSAIHDVEHHPTERDHPSDKDARQNKTLERDPTGTANSDSSDHALAIGLMNAGGLRVGLPAGTITLGQVLDAMPFGNTLATTTISGETLRAAALHGLTMTGRGGYAQWAGLRIQPTLSFIEVQAQDGTWSPLDPAKQYLLATNNFLRTGGDGYTMLKDGIDPYDTGPSIADLVADALAALPGK